LTMMFVLALEFFQGLERSVPADRARS